MNRYLGLDLGGTNIKVAVLALEGGDGSADPVVIAEETHPTEADRGPQHVVARLVEVGRGVIDRHGPVVATGIGAPGVFDAGSGEVVIFPKLPGEWRGRPLRGPVASGLGVPATLINDARAFTLAEGTLGAGAGCRTLVCVTLGTGVGGGLMIDGRLHLGAKGRAGEIGHQIVEPAGPRCGCGAFGCVEALTKAERLAWLAGKTTAEEVYREAAAGEPASVRAVETVAGYLGIALANTVVLLDPDRIVIGGGISVAGEDALGPIRRSMRDRVALVPAEEIDVVAADLGPIAGAIGAALAAVGDG